MVRFKPFPRVIAEIIAEYAAVMRMLDWIPKNKINKSLLFANSNADEAGMLDWKYHSGIVNVAKNSSPNAIPVILSGLGPLLTNSIDQSVWGNPAMFDTLMSLPTHRIVWHCLSRNPDERAVALLLANLDEISWYGFNMNPGAMSFLRENPRYIIPRQLCANPAAIDIIQAMDYEQIDWFYLSQNPHPWALDYLRINFGKIDWHVLAGNAGIFQYLPDPAIVDVLVDG